jgi:hypothetical protein
MKDFFHLVPGLLLSIFPFGGIVLTVWAFRLRGEGWRSSLIGSATCCALYVAFTTEILSALRQITRPALAIVWIAFDLTILFYLGHLSRKRQRIGSATPEIAAPRFALTISDYCLLAGILLIVTLVGLTAILAPPNTWDVISYHLARVAIWANNRDVGNYPTFYSQQLYLSPWAEYAILHLYVLSGADYLSNLVEWFSMIGLICGASLVAERLGAGIRGQILAAVSCATIPGLVLESSGSMNTCVGAFWIVTCVYYSLRANEDLDWLSYLGVASTAGLAVFTKGTAYVFLPFLILTCWIIGSTQSRKVWLRRLPLLALIFLVLNGPLYIRNYQLSGSPLGFSIALGADTQRQYANTKHSIGVTYANIVKNVALHLGTPSNSINNKIDQLAQRTLRIFGIDPDDTASTYRGGFMLPALSAHESTAGSLLQCILIAASAFLLFSKRYGNRKLRLISLGICASFILFCALLRWSPWNARYHLPLICLGLCVAAVVYEQVLKKATFALIGLLLLIFASPFALQNTIRPLAPWKDTSLFRRPRQDFYFEEWQQSQEDSYKFAVAQIRRGSCRNVGIDSSLDDFEYPLLAMLRSVSNDIRFRYYWVRNVSDKYVRPEDAQPCAVICLRCARLPAKWVEYKNIGGTVSTFDEIAVFSPNGTSENRQALTLPQPFVPEQLLRQLDLDRDAVGFSIYAAADAAARRSAITERIAQASRDWPEKSLDLQHRLHGIETLGLKAWRVRDSVDPMLKRRQRLNYDNADPLQFMAASELLTSWKKEVPQRFQNINDLIDQLYTSWELQLVTIPKVTREVSTECKVEVEKVLTTSNRKPIASSGSQVIQLEDCNCLKDQPVAGTVMARKRPGTYDSEATGAGGCKLI